MLRKSLIHLCVPKRKPSFVPHLSPDQLLHISSLENSSTDQVSVLLEELTRERLLVKSLRDETDKLRGTVGVLAQREAELADLDQKLREEKVNVSLYQSKLSEEELRRNDLKIDFQNYKNLVELEKVKLKQLKALPLILAGLGGALIAFFIARGDMLLEKEQAKYVKFELDQMWSARVKEIQMTLDQAREENDNLQRKIVSDSKDSIKYPFLSLGGYKIL